MSEDLLPRAADISRVVSDLLPSNVFFSGGVKRAGTDQLWPPEYRIVQNAVKKRQEEFATGRFYARSALRGLGLIPAPILADKNRVPIWPSGIVGSISHCDAFCGAIVAYARNVRTLGFDVEDASPLESDLIPIISSTNELTQAEAGSSYDRGNVAKCLFSIKESIFKAYFPVTRRFLDFKDVHVELDWASMTFAGYFAGEKSLLGSSVVSGGFNLSAGVVIATTVVPASGSGERPPNVPH
ncbi:4'-phosphopantetheinyl transferase EntD [Bradyrhizobium sp. USDA 4524]|uniref:4'-phosphopantetheinyl transferase family protein n=1 Tax=unclassified Bradyrhizobium TaxID=2631580 RepID=UPI0020A15A7F|nr:MULTISPECIES: 4'-phosphopantetheinyl transferase superfamily protein [unclassified Bradyrhizobium]MCP1845715.1 4'-phosphopantetheinyl transferase EntD [Bradyrhizobium sp. USDA 4538]MCP1906961.1 4'-phosphopantetheinyl transferase EntD [Bradyrhizobium sp. USDA 4537]MCP1985437.1 4'-phosphopantetheinyl transferase EntD [Bradyrhizobium sp. USDA 4539]